MTVVRTFCPCGVRDDTEHGCEVTYRRQKAEAVRLRAALDEAERIYMGDGTVFERLHAILRVVRGARQHGHEPD